ncbi:MAG: hypothetical protein B6V02_02610 [Thermoprotei archaeon ex4572_64]|nr:MAG: hypothetical protein B6V02_02610 [Thermoprotei archaeon ex4572_64]
MGKIIITTMAFKEKFLAEEIKEYLYLRGLSNIEYQVFNNMPGILIIDSSISSIELARIMLSSPLSRYFSRLVPILYETKFSKPEELANTILKEFRELLLRCSSFVVRCKLRSINASDSEYERIIGEIIRNEVNLKVNCESPNCIVIIECIEEWCGVYVGNFDYVRVKKKFR